MLTLASIAAGLMALPLGGDDVWFAPNLRIGPARSGQIYFELLVAPDRTILSCNVTHSDFTEQVGTRSCERLLQVQFDEPARDSSGRPVHGVFILVSSRIISNSARNIRVPAMPAHIVAEVSSLPDDVGVSPIIPVLVEVAEDGNILACQPVGESIGALTSAACEVATAYTSPVVQEPGGSPVRYVREVRVGFEVSQG